MGEDEEEPAFPWGDLPPEVQITVLGWLPLRPLFRLKSVCKLWNAIISSSTFTHFPSLTLPCRNSPWLIFLNNKPFDSLLAFDFTTRSWFTVDMRFLSRIVSTGATLPGSAMEPPCPIWCNGSSYGQLLLDIDCALHVCNPLTKSAAALPPFNSIALPVTLGFLTNMRRASINRRGKQLNAHGDSAALMTKSVKCTESADQMHEFTVVAVGEAKTGILFEEFRSTRNSWELLGSLPSTFAMRNSHMIECKGLFYTLLVNPEGMLVVGEGDQTGGPKWRVQSLPDPRSEGRQGLLACQNTLFLVCTGDNSNSFVIWRYMSGTRSWVMMDYKPHEAVSEDIRSMSCTNWVDCVGVGNYICIRAFGSLRVLTLDLSTETWCWLPEVPHPCDIHFTRGLPFEPRLNNFPTL